MKNLKNILYVAFAAVLTAGFVACSEDAPEYKAGKPDAASCYGVYFPTQEAAGDHVLETADEKAIEFKVMRTNTEGEITVPVKVTTSAEEGLFVVPEVKFADGQAETTVKVSFPNVKVSEKYDVVIEVADNQYISNYSTNPTFVAFSVVVKKALILLGTGTYTYSLFFESDDAGLELYQDPNYENCYKIMHWGADVTFCFSKNADNTVTVWDQFMGYVHASYGEVWVDEVSHYAGQEVSPSYYDEATRTFYFGVVYYVSAGTFGNGYETFKLD